MEVAFDAVYRRRAPEVAQVWRRPRAVDAATDPFAPLGPVEHRSYRWELERTAAEWVGATATASDHRALDPATRSALLDDLHATIESLGGTVRSRHETRLVMARR